MIADLASHVLDLVDWLIGPFRPSMAATQIAYRRAAGAGDPAERSRSTPRTACMLLARMQSGAPGHDRGHEDRHRQRGRDPAGDPRLARARCGSTAWTRTTWSCTTPRRPTEPLGGLRGWNRIDAGQRYPPPATGFPSPKAPIGWIRGHVACLANFLQAVARGPARRAGPGARHSRPAADGLPAPLGRPRAVD